jgi:hypothetical protein
MLREFVERYPDRIADMMAIVEQGDAQRRQQQPHTTAATAPTKL